MKVLLFFSFNTSLKTWNDTGMIDRELDFYNYLSNKHNCDFIFFTYGDKSDFEIKLHHHMHRGILKSISCEIRCAIINFLSSYILLKRNFWKMVSMAINICTPIFKQASKLFHHPLAPPKHFIWRSFEFWPKY